MTSTFSKTEDAPMRFDTEEGVTDFKMIKVSSSDADGNVCKEELPIFTNNSPNESLIQLLKEILAMQEHLEWVVEDGVNNDDTAKKKNSSFSILGEH